METQQVNSTGSARSMWMVVAVAVVMGLVLGAIGVIVFWPADSSAAAVTLVPAGHAGDDPFADSVQTGEVPVIEQPAVEAASAVRADLPHDVTTSVLVATGTAPGLYGGTGDAHVCDAGKLVSYLNDHQDKAKAFSEVLGIAPEGIGDYVATLTPVVLLSDTIVTNHGFKGGHATELTSVLQAGTAVMVDPQGVPRVKCNCGNPLTPPQVVPSGDWKVHGQAWDGYDVGTVTGVAGGDTVTEFKLCHLHTGQIYTQPVGSQLSEGTPPPNIDGDYTISIRDQYNLMEPLAPGDLKATCATTQLEGAVLVIRGTKASIERAGSLGAMEGTVEGTPKDSPEALAQIQQSLNGAVITVRPTGSSTPEIVFAVVPGGSQLAGGLRIGGDDHSLQLDSCASGVVATRVGSASAPTATTPTTSTTATTTPVPVASVSELRGVDWANRTYSLGEFCPGPDVTLRGGSFEEGPVGFGVRLAGVLYGDLTGDGHDEAVLKFECYAVGGNAYPATPNVVFTADANGPVQLGDPFIGAEATIVGDAVQTTESIWGPNDPRCCPSSSRTHTWQYSNGTWVSS